MVGNVWRENSSKSNIYPTGHYVDIKYQAEDHVYG